MCHYRLPRRLSSLLTHLPHPFELVLQGDHPFGVWIEAHPMGHRPPHNVKVINEEQAVRKGAKYPGEKHSNQPKCQVGSEWQVLEHAIYSCNGVPINFYRVQFPGEEASWLLDQSPSKDGKMLKIKYDT